MNPIADDRIGGICEWAPSKMCTVSFLLQLKVMDGGHAFRIVDRGELSMVLQFSAIDWDALYDGLQECDSSVCDCVKVLKIKGAPEGLLIAPGCFFYDSHTGKLRVAFPWKDRGRNGLVFEFQKSHRGATKTTKARML